MASLSTDHTIREFRAAATPRYNEGVRLAAADDRLAAIYLWGYAAEMLLKAAYFRLVGWLPRQAVTMNDLKAARGYAIHALGIGWTTSNLHDLTKWAALLVEARRARGVPYPSGFSRAMTSRVGRIYLVWREYLRYRPNRPYRGEVWRTDEALRWLMEMYCSL
jgi:hypothetical protein